MAANKQDDKESSHLLVPPDETTVWDERLDYLRDNRLSPLVEVVVAWIVALLCLAYYAYSYISLWYSVTTSKSEQGEFFFFPLVTSAKGKKETRTAKELFHQLLERAGFDNEDDKSKFTCLSDEELVRIVRSDVVVRRLVSMLFQQPASDVASVIGVSEVNRWKRLWPRLLQLPDLSTSTTASDKNNNNNNNCQAIALVLPAFREDGRRILRTLQVAVEHCQDPSRVQIIVVDAGQCSAMNVVRDFIKSSLSHQSSQVVEYNGGGGRGPTLDYGTGFAAPDIGLFTFLHSDTLLPKHWDASVHQTWFGKQASRRGQKKLQAVAFAFGQDKSHEGLNGRAYPWGIEAVQVLGNVRAYVASLPYGDHVLSMPLAYYRHAGGFPHQPIMEDYELMDYWRRRARHVSDETMTILPSMVRTGVRRWQTHGVVYVTLVNALIVYRYQRGWTPNDVFRYYYQRPSKKDR